MGDDQRQAISTAVGAWRRVGHVKYLGDPFDPEGSGLIRKKEGQLRARSVRKFFDDE
jgi:hypothetical protein